MSIEMSAPSGIPHASKAFYPLNTVRCIGAANFRSQLARDVACLLDVDAAVTSWSCQSSTLSHCDQTYYPDFTVEREGRIVIVDVASRGKPVWVAEAAAAAGYGYDSFSRDDLPLVRLRNAKDLLRYARFQVSLGDRIRLLAVLDENGSLTVAECLSAFRETQPVPGLASMVLNRFVEIDLDEALIGPETTVRRYRG